MINYDKDKLSKIVGVVSISVLGIICAIIDAIIKEDGWCLIIKDILQRVFQTEFLCGW